MNTSIFIGSSSEALPLAEAIRDELSDSFQSYLWSERLFEIGEDTLNNLLRFVQCYDFAILVLTEDDFTHSRKAIIGAPRDNVIFELGLFMGALGRRRAFAVVCKTDNGTPKIPSDLLGNNAVFLSKDFNPPKKIDPIKLADQLSYLKDTFDQRSKESNLQLLPSTGLAIGYFQNFVLPVCQELANRTFVEIDGNEIDISNDNFDFVIVLPKTLSDASIQGAKKFCKKKKVSNFTLKTSSRSYPFYVTSSLSNGRLEFYDYPTTLRASHEAIRIALSGPYLGQSKYHSMLDLKEIENFKRALGILLDESSAAEFRDNVKILQS